MQTTRWWLLRTSLVLPLLLQAAACGVPPPGEVDEVVAVGKDALEVEVPVDPRLDEAVQDVEPGLPPPDFVPESMFSGPSVTAMTPLTNESGFISLSVDGTGSNSASGGIVQVEKPAGATVRRAYLVAASTGFTRYQIPSGGVRIDGQGVTWDRSLANGISSWNYWADVTAMVRNKINTAPPGRVSFVITESASYYVDGEILVVIFDDPNVTRVSSVILLFGAQSTLGDTFHVNLAEPINKSDPNLRIDFSLGISYGYQSGVLTESQRSIVGVNGLTLTSLAGGQDDGAPANGALLTVGGLDDTNANPPPNSTGPGPRGDDELYNLMPLVADGTSQFIITSRNPSNDDNIFFAALNLRSTAAIIGEGIVLGPTLATGPVGASHLVTATLRDTAGNALPGRTVTFTVRTGPNAGVTGTVVSDGQGKANFTYVGSGGVGRDELVASFVRTSGELSTSNPAFMDWTSSNRPPIARCRSLVLGAGPTCGGVSASVDDGSSDPDGNLVGCTQSPGGPFGLGLTSVTLTCTDAGGLSSSCTATVLVEDRTAPVVTCPADRVAECVGGGAVVDTGLASATDACGPVTVSSPPPASYPLGTTAVTHSATDPAANTATCTSLVTVHDTVPPFFTSVPAPVVAEYTGPGTPVSLGMATSGDACGGEVTTSDAPALFPYGTTVVTFTATDRAGNQAQATTTVVVRDTTPPVLTTPTAIAAEATGPAGAGVWFDVSAYDLRDGVVLPLCTPASGSVFGFGTATVSCMATDSAGNMSTASFTVTVDDTTPPEYTYFPNDIIYWAWSPNGAYVTWTHPTANDLVDGVTPVTCTHKSADRKLPLGTTTVTCTTSDTRGNTNTRSFRISIIWDWMGFLPPIASDGSSQFPIGPTVPVRFGLAGKSRYVVDVQAFLYIAPVSGGVVGDETLAQPAPGQFVFTKETWSYDFNMATSHLSPGVYRLRADLGDGVTRTVLITLN